MKMKKYAGIGILLLSVLLLMILIRSNWNTVDEYEIYNKDTFHYVHATVLRVDNEETVPDDMDHSRQLGLQEITVQITSGSNKGSQVSLTNYLTRAHNVYVKQGTKIVICMDQPENAEPYYSVFNYDRRLPILMMILLFTLIIFLVGRGKGLRSLLGVLFTLTMIIGFTIPGIFHGRSPVLVVSVTVIVSSVVSILLMNRLSRRSMAALISTLCGTLIVGICFIIFSGALHLSGYNLDETETLIMVGQNTGMNISDLLLAGILISSIGAIMDVAVSLTAALDELVALDPKVTPRTLFRSGMNIGKDMIGTMSNTLILAFAGTEITTMLCLIAYGYHETQLIASDYLAIQLSQGLCATIGIILTVPVTAGICLRLLIKPNK